MFRLLNDSHDLHSILFIGFVFAANIGQLDYSEIAVFRGGSGNFGQLKFAFRFNKSTYKITHNRDATRPTQDQNEDYCFASF